MEGGGSAWCRGRGGGARAKKEGGGGGGAAGAPGKSVLLAGRYHPPGALAVVGPQPMGHVKGWLCIYRIRRNISFRSGFS